MEHSQLLEVAIQALDEWREMYGLQADRTMIRELEDQLIKDIDRNHIIQKEKLAGRFDLNFVEREQVAHTTLKETLAAVVPQWFKKHDLGISYRNERELERELIDQIVARELMNLRSQELRNAS